MLAINHFRKYLPFGKFGSESRNDIEQKYLQRLMLLSEVTNELSKEKCPDDLYRRVVELGRNKLDIDRLSLLFISRDLKSMRGSYGVDTNGMITDERNMVIPLESTSPIQPIVRSQG